MREPGAGGPRLDSSALWASGNRPRGRLLPSLNRGHACGSAFALPIPGHALSSGQCRRQLIPWAKTASSSLVSGPAACVLFVSFVVIPVE
jgi:hypothetical protein